MRLNLRRLAITYMPIKKQTIKIKTRAVKTKNKRSNVQKNKKIFNKTAGPSVDLKITPKATPDIREQKDNYKAPVNQSRSLGMYRKIAISFIVLTAMLLAIIFYFSFVKVIITLIPAKEHLSGNLMVDVYDKSKRSIAGNGAVVGAVKQIKAEQTKIYQSGGIEVIGEEVTGTVTIMNSYNKNQPLVATTRLLSLDNKLFKLKKTVNVPAGGQIKVEVYADEPGQDMAIGPTRFTIPGLWAGLQDKIYGESNEPMKYSKKVKKYIQQIDIDSAVKDLKQSLLEKAEIEIGKNYKDYDQVIYDIDNNSIVQRIDGKVGDEVEEFTALAETMVTVVAFDSEKIYELAQQKLISALPDDKELLEFGANDISYNLSSYNISRGIASLDVNFISKMVITGEADIIDPSKILGLTRQQLDDYLIDAPEIAGYEVKFTPSWIKKVPNLADRIKIRIKK